MSRDVAAVVDEFYGIRVMDSGNQPSSSAFQGAIETADALVVPVMNAGDAVLEAVALLDELRAAGGKAAALAANAIIIRLTDGRPEHPQVVERVNRIITRRERARTCSRSLRRPHCRTRTTHPRLARARHPASVHGRGRGERRLLLAAEHPLTTKRKSSHARNHHPGRDRQPTRRHHSRTSPSSEPSSPSSGRSSRRPLGHRHHPRVVFLIIGIVKMASASSGGNPNEYKTARNSSDVGRNLAGRARRPRRDRRRHPRHLRIGTPCEPKRARRDGNGPGSSQVSPSRLSLVAGGLLVRHPRERRAYRAHSRTERTEHDAPVDVEPTGCLGGDARDAAMVLAAQKAAPHTSNGAVEFAAALVRWSRRYPVPTQEEARAVQAAPSSPQVRLTTSLRRSKATPTCRRRSCRTAKPFYVSTVPGVWNLESYSDDTARVSIGTRARDQRRVAPTFRLSTMYTLDVGARPAG